MDFKSIHFPSFILLVQTVLCKSYVCLQISAVANFMVRMLNDLEVNSVSIERAKEYTGIASEVRSLV